MASSASHGASYTPQQHDSRKETPDMATYLNFSQISPSVQKHLQKVYLTLTAALSVVALGAYAHLYFNLGGVLSYFGTLACVIALLASPVTPTNDSLRFSLLMGVAFFKGCSLGPLLLAVADVDSSLIAVAFLATSAVFAAFSGAALLAKRREFLYLGGLCGSALSVLLALRLASWLFGSYVLQFQLELYVGLFIFAGYVIFDTQVMIEKASLGVGDYVHDALQLLLDFVAIFVRLLIILAKKQDRRSSEEKRSTKRR